MKFSIEKLRSPMWVFIIYVFLSSLLVFIFRFIFPPAPVPLIIFSREWRQIHGLLEVLNLFPALALSGLVVPFGFPSSDEKLPSFSHVLFKRLISSVLITIFTAIIYAIIFFLAIPIAESYEEDIRYKGELFFLARDRAQERARNGQWLEASQFLAICDQIWENNPDRDLENLRADIEVNLNRINFEEADERNVARIDIARDYRGVEITPLYTRNASGYYTLNDIALTASQAITLGREAFEGRRFFEAHWLASIGRELAGRGSPEVAAAAELASEAWNMIASLGPNPREQHLYRLHEMKVAGYSELNSGNWINAYYIFRELLVLTPDDPDAVNFFALSEQRTQEIAFFIDEMEPSLGEIQTGAIFSIPGQNNRRAVLRFSSLLLSQDIAYGMLFEYMEFDNFSNLLSYARTPYAKIMPFISSLDDTPKVLVLTHALDRNNKDLAQEGEWILGERPPAGILLDISFEEFLLLSRVRRGLPNLEINELFMAAETLGTAGYITQIFEAEILTRLGYGTFLLPIGILVIVIAWRFRTILRPRYFFVILLPILPIVFHGFVSVIKTIISFTSIWLVLMFGFSTAIVLGIVTLVAAVIGSLIILAAQHN